MQNLLRVTFYTGLFESLYDYAYKKEIGKPKYHGCSDTRQSQSIPFSRKMFFQEGYKTDFVPADV